MIKPSDVHCTNYHYSKTVPVGQKEPFPLPTFIPGGGLHWKGRRVSSGEPEETLQLMDTAGEAPKTTWVGSVFTNLWEVINNNIDHRKKIHNSTRFTSFLVWIRNMKFRIVYTKRGPWDLIYSALHEPDINGESPDKLRKFRIRFSLSYLVQILATCNLSDLNTLAKAAQKLAPV